MDLQKSGETGNRRHQISALLISCRGFLAVVHRGGLVCQGKRTAASQGLVPHDDVHWDSQQLCLRVALLLFMLALPHGEEPMGEVLGDHVAKGKAALAFTKENCSDSIFLLFKVPMPV